jgi:collagenase-like PrtC family protease
MADVATFLDAGADVIKIQGRSLFPETVGAITRRYRSAIDAWKNGQKFDGYDAALPAMWTVQGR